MTVDSSVDTAAEEKKLVEQHKKESKTDDGATVQNRGTEKQSDCTEIAVSGTVLFIQKKKKQK